MRAAIVGCGGIAQVHARSVSKMASGVPEGRPSAGMEGCSLEGFADIKIERAEAMAGEYGGRAYASLEEMLEDIHPDVLHICTPHYLHVPMAVYALEKGVNVFMEKPPAISTEQWQELSQAAQKASRKLGVCFQNRYNPSILYVKRLLAEGTPGRIKGARGLVTWSRGEAYYTQSGWRGSLATEGGGALINQSIHTLDLLGQFLGTPEWVEASIANHHLKGIIEVEDTMEAYIRYEKAAASFYATTAYCDDVPPLIEIACENMTIRIEDLDVTLLHRDGRVEKPQLDKKEALGKSYWGSGHADCIADFYRCCETNEHFAQEIDGIEDTARLMLAAYESARSHRPVEL